MTDLSKYTTEQIEKAKIAVSKKSLIVPLPKTTSTLSPILYVFRHGQSEDNLTFIFSGWRDPKLTDLGRKQAEILAEKMQGEKIDLGITSNLARSKETLEIVLKPHAEAKIEIDIRVNERSYGDLQGTSKLEMYLENPQLLENYRRGYDFPAKNGESLKMVEARVKEFLDELLPRMKQEKINVAVSCHSNSMRALRKWMENLTVEQMCELEDPLGQDFASYSV